MNNSRKAPDLFVITKTVVTENNNLSVPCKKKF